MKKDVKRRNKTLLIIGSILALILILSLSLFFFLPKEDENTSDPEKIHYYLPDYDENIYENKGYMSFERGLLYSAGGVEQLFHYDLNFDEATPECQFFLKYFHSVIGGEYETISQYYVDGFFEEQPKFTMQMIYEPYVMYHSLSTEEIDGESVDLYNFHVRYKIFKNNGTFRQGVGSNVAVPQIYQILKQADGSFKIYRILDVKNET